MFSEYVDDSWSGTNFERPSFQRMMDDVEAGKVNCIVTKDLSRFGREHILMLRWAINGIQKSRTPWPLMKKPSGSSRAVEENRKME